MKKGIDEFTIETIVYNIFLCALGVAVVGGVVGLLLPVIIRAAISLWQWALM